MLSAIFSFFATTSFRMIWGELASWLTAAREHAREVDRLQLQEQIAAAQHARNLAAIKVQAELGVQTIRVQAEADLDRTEAEAWRALSESTARSSGLWLIDAWNGVIRPGCATWAVAMVTGHYARWWMLDEQGWALCGAALGLYLAQRDLFKRGK